MPLDSHVIDTIREDLKTDAFAQVILTQVDSSRASCSQLQQPGTDYRQFECHDGLLFFKKLLYVPNGSCRLRVVQNCHDTYTTGHFGSTKTLDFGMPLDSHVIDTIREDLKTHAFAQAILVQVDPSRASCS